MNTRFLPMLAPNQQPNLNDIQYPILASYKLDGLRCIFLKGEMLSRSLKPIVNKQLREKFKPIADYSRKYDLILDGEIYSHELTFQEITRFVMTKDFEDVKSVKKHGNVLEIPNHLKYYCFDCIENDNFDKEFSARVEDVYKVALEFDNLIIPVRQHRVSSKEAVEVEFDVALENGFEGLILRSYEGRYKCGRGTLKEGIIYKVKPYRTFDGVITEVIQSTEVDPNAEKKTNELGRSVTSKKKDDRILIEKASAFRVDYEEHELKVVLAMTDDEKEMVWKQRALHIGRTIEYKGMLIGSKDVPRHPVMLRFIDKRSK
ncbi:MAG: hypothetical protein DRP08_07915 [Candidatus Aenigmatarchaeota archaeon]|nr:MAG: hypothetical protein DRP08_07915 [Candidatus Aenigmarchaeota archaeon]